MKIFILFYFIFISYLFANQSKLNGLLVDIQNFDRCDIKRYNLHLGWNTQEQVYISKGIAIFDYKDKDYLEDLQKYQMIATLDGLSKISIFLKQNISSKVKLEDQEISLRSCMNSSNIVNQALTIFSQVEDEKDNIKRVENFIIYAPNLLKNKIKSRLSVKEYLSQHKFQDIVGSRLYIDKNGDYNILNYSYYKSHGNVWKDKITADYLAKRDIVSMIKSSCEVSNVFIQTKNIKQNDNKQGRIINSRVKNIKKVIQKQFVDKRSNSKFYLTIYKYKIR